MSRRRRTTSCRARSEVSCQLAAPRPCHSSRACQHAAAHSVRAPPLLQASATSQMAKRTARSNPRCQTNSRTGSTLTRAVCKLAASCGQTSTDGHGLPPPASVSKLPCLCLSPIKVQMSSFRQREGACLLKTPDLVLQDFHAPRSFTIVDIKIVDPSAVSYVSATAKSALHRHRALEAAGPRDYFGPSRRPPLVLA